MCTYLWRVIMTPFISVLLLLAQIVGGEFIYTAQQGDSLTSIGARFGVDIAVLAEANELQSNERLQKGQTLKIDNRHIIPPVEGIDLVINIPQLMLFYFDPDGVSCGCPIAAGKPDWRTPLGEFEIISKEEDPTWDVPVSIQEEMRRSGKAVLTHVPPSPANPLGKYWIGLSLPGIGIHGTNAPTSIYKPITHGCIRLQPEDVRNLFPKLQIGMRGRIIYEPVLIAHADNKIFLEVHPDSYKLGSDPIQKVMVVAHAGGFADMLDMRLVKEVIRKRDGIARDVTRR
jgi:L,D-transpeptidase ErfK/SrfK